MTDWMLGVKERLELRTSPGFWLGQLGRWCYHSLIQGTKKSKIERYDKFHFVRVACEILLILVILTRMSPLQLLCLRKVQKV